MAQNQEGIPLARSPSRRGLLGLLLSAASVPLLAACVDPSASVPQSGPTASSGEPLSPPQLEQLLAPIALYPDALLAQVLMASTYPLEVVQAQRWLERPGHGSLSGTALEQALQAESWDVSVKSLVPFPEVLKRLNDNLEWTQQLGDAVLAQQQGVLTAIQTLRQRAQASGSLRSGAEQTVSGSTGAIVIEPAQPQIVYVPAYDPMVVYGAWPYPAYPPYYWPYGYGGVALAAGIGFAAGVAIAGSYWGWARPGWGSGDINIDVDRTRNINRDSMRNSGNRWQHDGRHRQGVAYRDQAVRDRYQGGNRGQGAAAREQFRGRAQQLPARSPGGGGQGFDGLGRGGDVRAASDRGRQSFGGQRGGGYGGGGYRGGGGYGGGGFGGGGGYRGGGGFGGGFRGGGGRGGRR